MDEADVIDVAGAAATRGPRHPVELRSLTVRELLTDLAASEAALRDHGGGGGGGGAKEALTREQDLIGGQDLIVSELERRRGDR